MRFALSEIAAAVGGEVVGDDVVVDGASIDSRVVEADQLFVPIEAERDGHDFIAHARDGAAVAHLATGPVDPPPGIRVADTTEALAQLGRLARGRVAGPVVGITGSVGKTTTKDLLAGVLATELRCAASERSFNNELGVPLTLVNAPDDVEVLVVEMGARGTGHIARLCDIARPTIAVVTRIAAVHTSEFESVEEIALAKGELVEALPRDGLAVLNADDERVAALAARTDAAVTTYGVERDADVRALDVELGDDLRARFVLRSRSGSIEVGLGIAGEHQVSNALAAAAVGLHLGLTLEHVAQGLAAGEASPWRMEIARSAGGTIVINDAYNANPTSMRAAFAALASTPAARRIAVLGHMAELGPSSDDDHRQIGREADELGFEVLAVGADFGVGRQVHDADAAVAALGSLDGDTAVLVKGSRVAGLERVAAALLEGP